MADEQPMIRIIGFHQTYEKIAKRNEFGEKELDDKGNPILEVQEEDWVTYAPAHAPISTQNVERVRHMKPTEEMRDASGQKGQFMKFRWTQIEVAYNAWKSGNEIPIHGTPLAQWAGVSSTQAEILRQNAIRTVEEVRDMTDVQVSRIKMPDVRKLVKSAALFLSNADNAASAQRESERDEKINALEEQLAAAMELLNEKTAAPVDDTAERDKLRAELDERGIEYHHKSGVAKLQAQLEQA